ncbi:hypothetical protein ACIQGZ_04330 [Streptomyces sp. NPDC092296]|uniref:hypothetical protein n=1 Tax=Streptomyces sp. NPDC092296 TaxID=3366012 RepID=UPI00381E4113
MATGMTMRVYRRTPDGGRHDEREIVVIPDQNPDPDALRSRFPPCRCPRCRETPGRSRR